MYIDFGLVVQLVIPRLRDSLSRTIKYNTFFKIMYWVYILESEKDNSFYIGQTNCIEKRIVEHNQGLSKYTSRKMPWKIVYTEEYNSREEADRKSTRLNSSHV